MSQKFYSANEELNFDDSLDNFEYLFKDIKTKSPSLKDALMEMFSNAKLSEKDSAKIYDDLMLHCTNRIDDKWEAIKKEHPNISRDDALVISSYTYEPLQMYEKYSPYRLLNSNLVATNRKNGVINVAKYLYLFLRALRGLKKCKKNCLFRGINCKVKLAKDPNNTKYIPYAIGNKKIFWPFTSTSDDESVANGFIGNGTGTKFKIEGDNLWGYDITLFNIYKEKEILLEPESKYVVENIKEDNNNIKEENIDTKEENIDTKEENIHENKEEENKLEDKNKNNEEDNQKINLKNNINESKTAKLISASILNKSKKEGKENKE